MASIFRWINSPVYLIVSVIIFFIAGVTTLFSQNLSITTFEVDVSPPLGIPVAYAPARSIIDPLSARGVVIYSDQAPVVLCAVDYLGIANEGLEAWKNALAQAAATSVDRVWVSVLHQHDGMRCDLTTERIMAEYGLGGTRFNVPYIEKSIRKVAKSVGKACKTRIPITHIGYGEAIVDSVASNRRILGDADTVVLIRWSKSTDAKAIAAPEGLIDPWLKSVSFWNDEKPVAALTYYATHPQSYYGQGDVTCEFVGIARNNLEKELGFPHIHFNGCSGNVTAGKYNDGSTIMRPILTNRMETGMRQAWENTHKEKLASADISWKSLPISLPLGKHLIEENLRADLANFTVTRINKLTAAKHLAWLLQTKAGKKIDISSLKLGNIQILNLPGELFIEYQLAAQKLKPELKICTAAYGEYGPGYIGTKISYSQGGYETSEGASRVSEDSEEIIMSAIHNVLQVKP
ncbi:MAG: hypothetical protein IPL46_29355 [Saprospiraceae bacterium]|nr:hypothetical protein [Saprospiraceae bacterium]